MNKLVSEIKELQSHVESLSDHRLLEEATKQALILPFFKALGYEVNNPREVYPEYIADIPRKKGEKVDYAIIKNRVPIILIECKPADSELSHSNAEQLFRYFTFTKARFGILTNGLQYRFYSDLDDQNRMDSNPFMEIDLLKDTPERIAKKLQKFTKSGFDESLAIDFAEKRKYITSIREVLFEQIEQPSDDFISFILDQVYKGTKTKKVKESFVGIVRDAYRGFINDCVRKHLKLTLDDDPGKNKDNKTSPECTSLAEFELEIGTSPPSVVRFWNETERELKVWKDLLRITAELLYKERLLTATSLPYNHGKSFRIHTKPEHDNGTRFKSRTETRPLPGTPIYMHINMSAESIIRSCIKLLEDFGKDPKTDVYLKVK